MSRTKPVAVLHGLVLAAVAQAAVACAPPACRGAGPGAGGPAVGEGAAGAGQASAGKVKVEFFVMSQCPYGVQVEQGIGPVMEKLGGSVDLTIDFISDGPDGKLSSMHGESEVQGDRVQLCALEHFPAKALPFINCMNRNPGGIPGNWEGCAQELQMDAAKMKACFEGQESADLLEASFDRARARKAEGSPTIFINGEPYYGARSEMSFTRAICKAFVKDAPAACKSLPPPVAIEITIVSDERCEQCSAKLWKGYMQGPFPDAEFVVKEYTTEEGKKFYDEVGLRMLPAVLFEPDVEKADNYSEVKRFLHKRGEYLELDIGATFDPGKEICDNGKDDTGDGRKDCDDDDCSGTLACRTEIPNRLDLFIMSQCPYGMMALDNVAEVLKNFGPAIDFHVNFIAEVKGDGIDSMHGQGEVDEDIRELCAIAKYGKDFRYMDYILCRNKNMAADWKGCTGGTGIDAKVIEKCVAGEGPDLLRENMKIAQGLGFAASPTWMANNRFQIQGGAAEQIKAALCEKNPGLANCDKKLSGPKESAQPAAGACGQ